MKFFGVKRTTVAVILVPCLLASVLASGNIESNGEGSYCINKIPKRGVLHKCSSTAVCEDLLDIALTEDNNIRCGDQGECVTKRFPRNEQCKEACGSSPCGKFCLQEHETKTAMYCIETRDHPNAMPTTNSTAVAPNKYFCTCLILEGFHRHRVISRYLRYDVKN